MGFANQITWLIRLESPAEYDDERSDLTLTRMLTWYKRSFLIRELDFVAWYYILYKRVNLLNVFMSYKYVPV